MITRIFTKKELDELNSALLLSSVVLEYIKKHNVNLYNDINENMSLNTDDLEGYIARSIQVLL